MSRRSHSAPEVLNRFLSTLVSSLRATVSSSVVVVVRGEVQSIYREDGVGVFGVPGHR